MQRIKIRRKLATDDGSINGTLRIYFKGMNREIDWILDLLREGLKQEKR